MNIHEYGTENRNVLVLIHPSLVMWDYFEYVIPLLSPFFHLVIPALPGYDPDSSGDFTSVEQIASELADWLIAHGHSEVCGVYGCSMGGSIVIRMLTDSRLRIRSAMIDSGITPYQLPRIVTRGIAVRDFLMIYLGKLGGICTGGVDLHAVSVTGAGQGCHSPYKKVPESRYFFICCHSFRTPNPHIPSSQIAAYCSI